MMIPALFHEREPSGFRTRFRFELSRSASLDIAVTRIRLGTIGLSREEMAGITRIRLLLAEFRAVELDAEAHALMARRHTRAAMADLEALLERHLVHIRVAPLGGWSPDFSVFSDFDGPRAVLLGFHAFESPHPHPGPALGAHFGRAEAREARARFESLWARGHDVAPAVHSIFRRARRWVPEPEVPAGTPDPVDTPQTLG